MTAFEIIPKNQVSSGTILDFDRFNLSFYYAIVPLPNGDTIYVCPGDQALNEIIVVGEEYWILCGGNLAHYNARIKQGELIRNIPTFSNYIQVTDEIWILYSPNEINLLSNQSKRILNIAKAFEESLGIVYWDEEIGFDPSEIKDKQSFEPKNKLTFQFQKSTVEVEEYDDFIKIKADETSIFFNLKTQDWDDNFIETDTGELIKTFYKKKRIEEENYTPTVLKSDFYKYQEKKNFEKRQYTTRPTQKQVEYKRFFTYVIISFIVISMKLILTHSNDTNIPPDVAIAYSPPISNEYTEEKEEKLERIDTLYYNRETSLPIEFIELERDLPFYLKQETPNPADSHFKKKNKKALQNLKKLLSATQYETVEDYINFVNQ